MVYPAPHAGVTILPWSRGGEGRPGRGSQHFWPHIALCQSQQPRPPEPGPAPQHRLHECHHAGEAAQVTAIVAVIIDIGSESGSD